MMGSRSSGIYARRDCWAAAWSLACHLALVFATRSERNRTMERWACHGVTLSTPISVAISAASMSRSALAKAWTRLICILGGWCTVTELLSIDVHLGSVLCTLPVALVPTPSLTRTG